MKILSFNSGLLFLFFALFCLSCSKISNEEEAKQLSPETLSENVNFINLVSGFEKANVFLKEKHTANVGRKQKKSANKDILSENIVSDIRIHFNKLLLTFPHLAKLSKTEFKKMYREARTKQKTNKISIFTKSSSRDTYIETDPICADRCDYWYYYKSLEAEESFMWDYILCSNAETLCRNKCTSPSQCGTGYPACIHACEDACNLVAIDCQTAVIQAHTGQWDSNYEEWMECLRTCETEVED